MTYTFRRATEGDLPLLNEWIGRPHVAAWWEDAIDADDLADPQSRAWIVALDDRPFAHLQDYAVHGFGPHPFDYLPAGARGTDQFIGEADLLDRGHGAAMLRHWCERLFAEDVPVVGVDPHPDNARAIAAYRRAGFVETERVLDTDWGRCLLMERWAPR